VSFVGTHEHTLDGKGRLVLPSKYRSRLAERAYVSPGAKCLDLWTPEAFDEMVERLTVEVREGRTEPQALRGIGAFSAEVAPDSQGRVMLPERLREFAGLSRNVVVNGAFSKIEIWDADRWAEQVPDLDVTVAAAIQAGSGI